MKYIKFIISILLFVIVLFFSLKNTELLTVYFFIEAWQIQVPSIIVMFTFFIFGSVLSFLFSLPKVIRRRQEISRLRREVEDLKKQLTVPDTEPVSPDVSFPIHPL